MSNPLWTPSPERVEASNLTRFIRYVNESCGLELDGFDALYAWSVRESERFWDRMWHFGGIVSFQLNGGREQAWRLIDNTRMLSITANLGDTKSTITHPASTTHGRLTQEQRDRAGIDDGLVRISVGLEEIADIKADLATVLEP